MAFDFIPPSAVIAHLRTKIPSFSNRVAGASDFDAIENEVKMPVPSCFVLLGNNSATTLGNYTGIQQRIGHAIEVYLYLDAIDIRKQEAEQVSVAFKKAIIQCLNGWKPLGYDNASPLEFVGDQLHATIAGRYARVYQFIQKVDFDSSYDGEGQVGDFSSLDDFDTLMGSVLADVNGDDVMMGVTMEEIHE